jgi:hypothetical protein
MNRPNKEGVGARDANPLRTHSNEQANFASSDAIGKAFASMLGQAARRGCTLRELSDGRYLIGGRGHIVAVPCLRAVGDLLRQIGRSS